MSSVRNKPAGKTTNPATTTGGELDELTTQGKKKSSTLQPSTGPDTGSAPKLTDDGQTVREGKLPARPKTTGTGGVVATGDASTALVRMPKISAAAIQLSTANFPTRQQWHQDMVAFHNQPVNKAAVAKLKNTYSPNFYKKGMSPNVAHAALRKAVPVSALREWGEAKLTSKQYDRTMLASFLLGNLVPMGGMAINMAAYPTLTAFAPSGWGGVAARVAVAGASAAVTSAIQPFVVQFQEGIRQRMAPSVARAKEITAKLTPEELTAAKKQQAAIVRTAAQNTAQRLSTLSDKYEVAPPQNGATEDEMLGALHQLHSKLNDAEKEEVLTLFKTHIEAETKLVDLKTQELGYESLNEREKDARKDQRWVRSARSGAGVARVFVEPHPAQQSALDNIKHDSRWSAGEASALVAKIQAGLIVAQMPFAGLDEWRHAVRHDIAMGLLYADVYNDKGKKDLRAGKQVGEDGIDEKKFNALWKGESRSVVDRVTKVIQQRAARLEAEIKALGKKGDTESVAAELSEKQARLNELKADLGKIKVGGNEIPDIMGLTQGGETEQLLDSAIKPFALAFKIIDGKEKLVSGDYMVQLAERMGQTFSSGGLTGNLGAIAGTSIVSAALGGSSELSLAKQLGVQVAGAVIGYITASLLYTASVVKAQAREREGGMSTPKQIWGGVSEPFKNGVRLLLEKLGKSGQKISDQDMDVAMRESEDLMRAGLEFIVQHEAQVEAEAKATGEEVELSEAEIHAALKAASNPDDAGPSFVQDVIEQLGIAPEQQQKVGSSSQG